MKHGPKPRERIPAANLRPDQTEILQRAGTARHTNARRPSRRRFPPVFSFFSRRREPAFHGTADDHHRRDDDVRNTVSFPPLAVNCFFGELRLPRSPKSNELFFEGVRYDFGDNL